MIQWIKGCALCLDWTGEHRAKDCKAMSKSGKPYEACTQKVGGGVLRKAPQQASARHYQQILQFGEKNLQLQPKCSSPARQG